jgi:DNA repair exonuclease SbcCD ATPase subunit
MNSTITFPPAPPALKLTRAHGSNPPSEERWAATLNEERRRLHEDQEALRLREANLREYEARLRALQAEIEAGGAVVLTAPARGTATPFLRPSSKVPFENEAALQAAWEKLHRSRELLEAEQKNLRDERIVFHEQEKALRAREEALAAREARVAEFEKLIAAAAPTAETAAPAAPVASEHTMSAAVTRLTLAPFAMARSVFGGKK